jgi:hypothetical protein
MEVREATPNALGERRWKKGEVKEGKQVTITASGRFGSPGTLSCPRYDSVPVTGSGIHFESLAYAVGFRLYLLGEAQWHSSLLA